MWIGRHCAFQGGTPTTLELSVISKEMAAPDVQLRVDLGLRCPHRDGLGLRLHRRVRPYQRSLYNVDAGGRERRRCWRPGAFSPPVGPSGRVLLQPFADAITVEAPLTADFHRRNFPLSSILYRVWAETRRAANFLRL